jgi:hypothetical protein
MILLSYENDLIGPRDRGVMARGLSRPTSPGHLPHNLATREHQHQSRYQRPPGSRWPKMRGSWPLASAPKGLSFRSGCQQNQLLRSRRRSEVMRLLEPILVELSGDISSGAFQLLGEADAVISTPGVTLATMSDLAGMTDTLHLGPRLSDPEMARLALLGSSRPMTADRAAQLGLIDELVPFSNLRRRSTERLRQLAGLDLQD